MNILINFIFSAFLTCQVDIKEKTDMIKKLEKVIYKDKKNKEVSKQRLTELGKRLYIRDNSISYLEIELESCQ